MIKPLTSLRFFAALAVLYDHLGTGSHTGGLGVIFFFLLSGFIITYTYQSKASDLSVSKLFEIYLSRAGRIFPLHLFTLILSVPLAIVGGAGGWGTFLANALLVHSWYPSYLGYFSYNSVSWTLSIEWAFYLLFPFLLYLIRKFLFFNSRLGVFFVYIIPLLILGVMGAFFLSRTEQYNFYWWLFKISPMNVLIFFCGVALALRHVQAASNTPSPAVATIIEVGSLVMISGVYYILVRMGVGKNLPFDYVLIFIPFFSLCIGIFACSAGVISTILCSRLLVKLGELGFSIYMLHLLMIKYCDLFLYPVSGANASTLLQVVLVLVTIIFSYASFTTVESPCRKVAKAFSKKMSDRFRGNLS